MAKYKILYSLNQARVAGTEKHVLSLLNNLNREVFEPHVVCLSEGPLVALINEKGDKAKSFNRTSFFDLKTAYELYKFMRTERFDIVHGHGGLFACFIGRLARVPHIIETRHGLLIDYDKTQSISPLAYIFNRGKAVFVDMIVTVSQADRKLMLTKFNMPEHKLCCIQNGVDEPVFNGLPSSKALRSELGIRNDARIVGTIARFTEEKGLKYLIKAVAGIREKHANTQFVLVGDGILRDELMTMAKQTGAEEDIIFAGYRDDAVALLKLFDLFVLPSIVEGMPYALLEAMTLKKAVVCTNIFGNQEVVINGETGLLIPPRDSKALSDAINNLLDDYEQAKKMGEAGYLRIKKDFSAKKMTEKIESLYLDLLSE